LRAEEKVEGKDEGEEKGKVKRKDRKKRSIVVLVLTHYTYRKRSEEGASEGRKRVRV